MILHMTNIEGLGATQVMEHLMPELLARAGAVTRVLIPDSDRFSAIADEHNVPATRVRRRLPRALSRTVEILLPDADLRATGPVLVCGDLPIRGVPRQVVFVHNLLLAEAPRSIKTWAMQRLFAANLRDAAALIVQTGTMKAALMERYGISGDRIHVIPQPAPAWIGTCDGIGDGPARDAGSLRLFYPARGYPHKNHGLLRHVSTADFKRDVAELVLTLPQGQNPAPDLPGVRCVGELAPEDMRLAYGACDAVLCLSKAESYGLTLVEAMCLGKPIVCADLPYARAQCGEGAEYFDPDDPSSLMAALGRLRAALDRGARPDWSGRLAAIPKSWSDTARAFLDVCETVARP